MRPGCLFQRASQLGKCLAPFITTLIRHAGHGSSPFCWLSRLEGGKNTFEPLGGRTEFCTWVTKTVRDAW